MPFCENCGNNVSETTKFCSICGNKIVNQRQDLGKVAYTEEPKIKSKSRTEGKQNTIVYHQSNWVRQFIIGLALLFLFFLSFLKNPTNDDFIKELENRYQEKFKTELKQEGLMAGILGLFSSGLDFYLNSNYKRSDLIFFSIYHREVANTPKVIAIGFWNNFFFLEEPFPSSSENVNKVSVYENTEESLIHFLEIEKITGGPGALFNGIGSISQDDTDSQRWIIKSDIDIDWVRIATYMQDKKTFKVKWIKE